MERQFLLDIANYQANLTDFGAVARDGYAGAIVLASDGDWQQPYFHRQVAGLRAAGLMTAAYHYQRENVSAQRQIDLITSRVPTGTPVVIDVEHHSGRGVAGVDLTRTIVAGVRARGYRVPLVYIPRWYWTAPVNAEKGGLGYASLAGLPPLWVSWYPDYVTRPKDKGADQLPDSVWTGYGGLPVALAQYTSSGRVAGYSGPVDQNVFRGSRAQLAALFFGGETKMEVPKVELDDKMLWWDSPDEPAKEFSIRSGFYGMHYHAKQADIKLAEALPLIRGIQAQVAAIAANPDITPEELARQTNEGIAEQLGSLAEAMRAMLVPIVEQALARVQDADNVDEARQTVHELLDQIHQRTNPDLALALRADVSAKNQDGVRGGSAAPDGVGGPTKDDVTGNKE